MTSSSPRLSRSYSLPIADKSEFALRAATAFLITAAVAFVLIHAGAWGGVLPDHADILSLLY